MKATFFAVLAVILLSCASMSESKRLDKFEEAAEAYRRILLSGDFAGAALFIDSAGKTPNSDSRSYKLLKITEYNIVRFDLLEDKRRIAQKVDLQYYFLNVNRLKNVQYVQTWLYDEPRKVWLLQTDLPQFD